MKRISLLPCQSGNHSAARRRFIRNVVGATAGLAAPSGWASLARDPERSLAFLNLHTGESLKTTFRADGTLIDQELAAINRILRDHRSGEIYHIDPLLLDTLHLLQQSVSVDGPFHIISGYRSPSTNAKLHAHSSGVAKRSLHMQGKAVDIRLPGCRLKDLRNAALALGKGGVGYYPDSNFVHVDTGRVRRW